MAALLLSLKLAEFGDLWETKSKLMSARDFQNQIKPELEKHFGQSVVIEWSISKGATDKFAPNILLYSPRVDVAVNPAGIHQGNKHAEILDFWESHAPEVLKQNFAGLLTNPNPRCSLAIEVVYNGSAKHILGDIANASMMGLYGVVIPSAAMESTVNRAFQYINVLRFVGKAPQNLFQNVRMIRQQDFLNLI